MRPDPEYRPRRPGRSQCRGRGHPTVWPAVWSTRDDSAQPSRCCRHRRCPPAVIGHDPVGLHQPVEFSPTRGIEHDNNDIHNLAQLGLCRRIHQRAATLVSWRVGQVVTVQPLPGAQGLSFTSPACRSDPSVLGPSSNRTKYTNSSDVLLAPRSGGGTPLAERDGLRRLGGDGGGGLVDGGVELAARDGAVDQAHGGGLGRRDEAAGQQQVERVLAADRPGERDAGGRAEEAEVDPRRPRSGRCRRRRQGRSWPPAGSRPPPPRPAPGRSPAWARRRSACIRALHWANSASCSAASSLDRSSPRSWPAQKILPSAPSTTTRTADVGDRFDHRVVQRRHHRRRQGVGVRRIVEGDARNRPLHSASDQRFGHGNLLPSIGNDGWLETGRGQAGA